MIEDVHVQDFINTLEFELTKRFGSNFEIVVQEFDTFYSIKTVVNSSPIDELVVLKFSGEIFKPRNSAEPFGKLIANILNVSFRINRYGQLY